MEQGYVTDITPITKIKTIVYSKMEIRIKKMNLGENNVEMDVLVYDESKENVKLFSYCMDGTAYLDWLSDNYLFTWVRNKLKNEIF